MNCVEDEIHSLIICPLYIIDRDEVFEEINKNNKNFYSLSNKEKFLWIMSNENDRLLTRLGNFLISIFKTRNSTIQEQKIYKSVKLILFTSLYSQSMYIVHLTLHLCYKHLLQI